MTERVVIPEVFALHAAEVWGADGAEWAARLPQQVEDLSWEWGFDVEPSSFTLSYNYVAAVRLLEGGRAVLKLTVPRHDFPHEVNALRVFDGNGAPRVIRADIERGGMLIERVFPGTTLLELGETPEAVTICVDVMRRLWHAPPEGHTFPTVADWAKAFTRHRSEHAGGSGPLPANLFDEAEATFAELIASSTSEVVLHGDLHHWNILAAGDGRWVAIDPHGVVGEREYEVGAFMRNPNIHSLFAGDAAATLSRRLDQFAAELGFERERLRRWSFAQCLLSAIWSAEDEGTGWEHAIRVAELLREV